MSAQSKLTAQAQVSVPAAIRRALGVVPGSVIVWETQADRVVVRSLGRHASADIHLSLFGPLQPEKKSSQALKEGITAYVRAKHARLPSELLDWGK